MQYISTLWVLVACSLAHGSPLPDGSATEMGWGGGTGRRMANEQEAIGILHGILHREEQ
ncbi:hypothetical protein CCM_09391 [Cordyceps militaris CM01]|uniref:Uncharacterized protein n=1 Tax=Cordyceps militaris (strain CM01) TaxID=983644 RepID=G3JU48_CORMM|nr:uncharacterized protein CCM_09391 [Cordyceps militaris CM01]EGX87769.1 hypothetical protein CCM_09391 [Cordyceps militaris CM01]